MNNIIQSEEKKQQNIDENGRFLLKLKRGKKIQ